MFTEKYRPHRLDDIVGNQPIINAIKSMMPNITHLLFKGPAGVGKTTTALAIVNELGCTYKELNTSDERGIATVQTTIKGFARTASIDGNFKVIILDEVDASTPDFQTALRRLMEQYYNNCRFILTCNNPQKIIEPIHSRCRGGEFEFLPIQYDDFKLGVLRILKQEGITITEDALKALYEQSKGDMRIIDKLYTISFSTKNIKLDDIVAIKDDDSWRDIFNLIKKSEYTQSCKLIQKRHVAPLFNAFMEDKLIEDKIKGRIAKYFAEYDYRKSFAVSEYIQLYSLLASIIDVLNNIDTKKSITTGNPFKKL